MTANKTNQNDLAVSDFLDRLDDQIKKQNSFEIIGIMERVTGFEAKMWGTAIIGFGSYHYKYDSGRSGDAPLVSFSPRKDAIALYLSEEFDDRNELLAKFGKHKMGKACIYIKKLADIDQKTLVTMIENSVKHIQNLYP
ncbi:DUF1801 domain-containing protein [Pedobacter agri]|uniref:DUF1801 domain-containing protein n=1 Tax=Pedobacter agri TaxID=454586 RepID=UPI00292D5889|nr:DUF1801 domain-containing protein [Pedobacter agri]